MFIFEYDCFEVGVVGGHCVEDFLGVGQDYCSVVVIYLGEFVCVDCGFVGYV